eukprot:29380-Pelagococcus_subviridis.AAC.25
MTNKVPSTKSARPRRAPPYAAGNPPRALSKVSVNRRTTGSDNPGGSVRIASMTPYCMLRNVHIRAHTFAVRARHRARCRHVTPARPPPFSPPSLSASGRINPRHEYFAIAHCRRRSILRPTSPPTNPPRDRPRMPRPSPSRPARPSCAATSTASFRTMFRINALARMTTIISRGNALPNSEI